MCWMLYGLSTASEGQVNGEMQHRNSYLGYLITLGLAHVHRLEELMEKSETNANSQQYTYLSYVFIPDI